MRSKRTDCGTSADLGNPGWNRGKIGHYATHILKVKVYVWHFYGQRTISRAIHEAASMPRMW